MFPDANLGQIGAILLNAALSLNTVVVTSQEQVSCPLGGESSILSLRNNVYYSLDPVGTRVWELLREARSVGEIRDVLLQEYDVEADRCERDLLDILGKLHNEGLIEVVDAKVS